MAEGYFILSVIVPEGVGLFQRKQGHELHLNANMVLAFLKLRIWCNAKGVVKSPQIGESMGLLEYMGLTVLTFVRGTVSGNSMAEYLYVLALKPLVINAIDVTIEAV